MGTRDWLRERQLLGMASAVRHPITSVRSRVERRLAQNWCAAKAQDFTSFAALIDSELLSEALDFEAEITARKWKEFQVLRERYQLGGGGHIALLYFTTRLFKPMNVVETGVAAGWSSVAVLSALRKNGSGHLYSSDLPYQRPWLRRDYSDLVGSLVDEDLADLWTLYLGPDSENIPAIIQGLPSVDLVHYDSDKSYGGRSRTLNMLLGKLAPTGAVVVDDINDNLHFKRLSSAFSGRCAVFGSAKYAGLLWTSLSGL